MTIKLELSITVKNCKATLPNREREELRVSSVDSSNWNIFIDEWTRKTGLDVNLEYEILKKKNLKQSHLNP